MKSERSQKTRDNVHMFQFSVKAIKITLDNIELNFFVVELYK